MRFFFMFGIMAVILALPNVGSSQESVSYPSTLEDVILASPTIGNSQESISYPTTSEIVQELEKSSMLRIETETNKVRLEVIDYLKELWTALDSYGAAVEYELAVRDAKIKELEARIEKLEGRATSEQ